MNEELEIEKAVNLPGDRFSDNLQPVLVKKKSGEA